MRIRFIVCAATFALVVGACGSDDATTVVEPIGTEPAAEAARDAPAEPAAEAARDAPAEATDSAAQDESPTSSADEGAPVPALAGHGDVPDLQMINMHTAEAISLQSVVDGQTPLLFWFWAPH